MTITTCLTVSSGLQDIEVEVEVDYSVVIDSYTAYEPPTMDCPGEPEQIEWHARLLQAVTVGGVVVMHAGTVVPLSDTQREQMQRDLLAEGREARELSEAGL